METILVIERESHLRQLLEMELSDANYTCVGVVDGDQAAEVLLFEKIDAIVLGVGWPPQDDLHTLFWVKKFYPDIPVILFAAEEDLQPKSIVRVADAWVNKCSYLNPLIEKLKFFETFPEEHGIAS